MEHDLIIMSTNDEWNGQYGIIDHINYMPNGEPIYSIFCVPMAGYGHYYARRSNFILLEKES